MRLLITIVTFGAVGASALAQQPPLNEVLRRVGEYLLQYEARLSTVVAEERYEQWINNSSGRTIARRSLVSDFLLIRVADPRGGAWLGFRDVVRVDGRTVRDGGDRLVRSLAKAGDDVRGELEKIGDENARYNLGDVYRTLNVPTLAMDFLHPAYSARSMFRRRGDADVGGTRAWRIEFAEHGRPSLIRGEGRRDRLARGSIWIDPSNGAVLQTELEVGGDDAKELLRARVTVEFRHDPTLDVRVPIEMRERYEQRTRQTEGRATYTNFRRFETSARVLQRQ